MRKNHELSQNQNNGYEFENYRLPKVTLIYILNIKFKKLRQFLIIVKKIYNLSV